MKMAFLVTVAVVALAMAPGAVATARVVGDPGATVEAVVVAVQDPNAAASDPAATVDSILNPDQGQQTPPQDPGNGQGDDGGWADQVRAAFHDQFTVIGLTALGVAGLGLAGFALVTRYVSPKEALKNPQRAMLFGFIKGNPGVHLKRLSDEFDMKTSSILWHIRKLECAELVHSERANGFRVFYPVAGGVEVKNVSRATTALQNDNARQIFERLQDGRGTSAATVASELAMNQGTVRWHLKKLQEFALVEEIVRGETALYLATPLGRRALQAVRAMPAPSPAVAVPA